MSKTNAQTQAVATKNASAVAAYDPEIAKMLEAPEDYNNLGAADISTPFLVVLQALSPQCTPGHADYNEAARPGMISHTITKQLYGKVTVTPVEYTRVFNEWVPRDAGGGFRGSNPATPELEADYARRRAADEKGRAILDNGNELIQTLTFFCFLHDDDGNTEPVIINFAKTQEKAARNWNQMMMNYAPPGMPRGRTYKRFAARYVLGTELARNDQGTWFKWKVVSATANDPATIAQAAAFQARIRGGDVVANYEAEATAQEASDSDASRM